MHPKGLKSWKFRYAFVQFELAESAIAVLSVTHKIENNRIEVRAAHSKHQPIFTSPEFDSELNINRILIDDCLYAIFRWLNIVDLSNVADVCRRFNQLAKDIFLLQHKSLDCNDCIDWSSCCFDSDIVKKILQNFGSLTEAVTVNGVNIESGHVAKFLGMISQHCDLNVKSLTLAQFVFNDLLLLQLEPLLPKLENMTIENCVLDGETVRTNPLNKCTKLKSLRFISSASYWNNGSWHLVKVVFNQCFGTIVHKFMSMKKLTMIGRLWNDRSFETIRFISEMIPNLVELEFYYQISHLTPSSHLWQSLSNLNNLKVLKFSCLGLNVLPLVAALASKNIPIEHLMLYFGEIDDNGIENVSKLKNIKILMLSNIHGLSENQLVKLSEELPKLQELYLCGNRYNKFKVSTIVIKKMLRYANKLSLLKLNNPMSLSTDFDIADYKDILKIVLDRINNIKLLIETQGWADIMQDNNRLSIRHSPICDCCIDIEKHLFMQRSKVYSFQQRGSAVKFNF